MYECVRMSMCMDTCTFMCMCTRMGNSRIYNGHVTVRLDVLDKPLMGHVVNIHFSPLILVSFSICLSLSLFL